MEIKNSLDKGQTWQEAYMALALEYTKLSQEHRKCKARELKSQDVIRGWMERA